MFASPTLDQLQIFLTVVETGSFSAAARALNRAQSVISYAIANLEAQIEMPLFERAGARQPKLTEAGTALLEDARRILSGLHVMRARIKSLKDGQEGEIALAISVLVPTNVLVGVLRDFRDQFPSVSVALTVGELGAIIEAVASGKASIGIGGAPTKLDDTLVTDRIGHSFMIPVVAPDHPLAKRDKPLSITDVRDEIQIVVTDLSGLTKGRDFNVLSYRTWRVSDVTTKYHLIRGGLGWGGLPASLIWDDLKLGRLVQLDLDAYAQGEYPIYVVRKLANSPGPATRWMIDAFRSRLSSCPDHTDFTALLAATGASETATGRANGMTAAPEKVHRG
jgi:DNA-binding transcriptional LysR family regulator